MPRLFPLLPLLLASISGCLLGEDAPGEGEPDPSDGAVDLNGLNAGDLAWSALTAGPTPRTEVVVGNLGSKFYVIGGFIEGGPTGIPQALVETYDAERDAWSKAPDYPLQIHHSVAVPYEGSLYVLGGLATAAFQPTALAFRFDPDSNEWRPLAPMPRARGSHGAALIGDKIYLAGGRTLDTNHVPEVDVYDVQTNAWTTLTAPLPTLRDHTSAASVGGRLYVMGGDVAGHGRNTEAAEAFDPATGTWEKLAPVPTVRGSLTSIAWRDRILVLGGQNATQAFDTVDAFDPRTDSWTALPSLLVARHGFGGGVWNEQVYVFSGGPRPGLATTSSVERLGPAR